MLWDPIEWEHKTSAVIATAPKVAIGNGTVLAVYDNSKIWLTDASKQNPIYQQLDQFWEGTIKDLVFIDHYIILNAESGLFIVEIKMGHNFKVIQVKKVDSWVASLAHTQYQSVLVVLSQNYRDIQFLRLDGFAGRVQKVGGNPLTNEGLVCAGGYSAQDGCHTANYQMTTNNYGSAEQRV